MDGRTAADDLEGPPVDGARSNRDLTEAAAAGLRWVAYARIAIEILLVGSMVVLARLIPPAAFGIFAVVAIVQELALTMPLEGIGGAIVQRRSVSRDHLQGGLALNLLVSLGLTALTALAAITIAKPLFGEQTALLILATTPCFLLGAIYALPMAVLRRRLDFRRLSIIDVSLNGTRALATLALAIAGLDAPALVFGGIAGMAVGVVLALIFAPVPLPRWRWRAARDLLPYGGPAGLATVAWTGFRNGDYAVIGAMLGPAQAGIYWRAYQLAVEYQSKVATAMTQIAFPVLGAHRRNRGDAGVAPADGAVADRRRVPASGPARAARARRNTLAFRPGMGAGGGADADPRARRGGDARDQRLRVGSDGGRARAARCSATGSPTSSSMWAR